MTTATSEDVQQQVLAIVRKGQELTLDAIKQAVETVNAAAEKLPAVPFAGKLPHLSAPSKLPGVSALPTPEKIVSATFDLLDRLLAEQRRFAGEVVKTTAALHAVAKPGAAKAESASEEAAPAAEAE